MGVTIKQIAEAAGVSRGTVDRALNNRSGIKPEIAEHVKQIAKEMGYKPNLAAKLLSEQQYIKWTIGIILVTENNPFFDEVLQGVKTALNEFAEFGIRNIVKTMTSYDTQLQIQLIDELVESGVNGIVLTPIHSREIADKINELSEKGIKFVTINTDILDTARIAYVGCRHKKSGAVLAGLLGLLANGNPRKIGIITGTKKNLAVTRRFKGLLETLEQDFPNIKVLAVYENEDNEELSYIVTKKLLMDYEELDTVCVLGAGIIGSIQAVKELELRQDLKVMVYDLIEEVKQALKDNVVDATITQEPFKQGYEGVQILAKYLAYNQLPEKELNFTELAVVTKYCLNDFE